MQDFAPLFQVYSCVDMDQLSLVWCENKMEKKKLPQTKLNQCISLVLPKKQKTKTSC